MLLCFPKSVVNQKEFFLFYFFYILFRINHLLVMVSSLEIFLKYQYSYALPLQSDPFRLRCIDKMRTHVLFTNLFSFLFIELTIFPFELYVVLAAYLSNFVLYSIVTRCTSIFVRKIEAIVAETSCRDILPGIFIDLLVKKIVSF